MGTPRRHELYVKLVAALMAIDAGLERLRHAVLEKGADDDR